MSTKSVFQSSDLCIESRSFLGKAFAYGLLDFGEAVFELTLVHNHAQSIYSLNKKVFLYKSAILCGGVKDANVQS